MRLFIGLVILTASQAQQPRPVHLTDGTRATLTVSGGTASLSFQGAPAIPLQPTSDPDTFVSLRPPATVYHVAPDGLLTTGIRNSPLPASSASQPSMQGPRHYAPGEYRLVKDGNSARLYLQNSPAPIPLTMAAPNMYVSSTGVVYSEVQGNGLYETSTNLSAFSPEAIAESEKQNAARRRAAEYAQEHPAGAGIDPSAIQLLGVSVSRYYPVHDFGPDRNATSNLRAVIDFNGRQVPVWGLNEKAGIKTTEINGHPQWYRSQQNTGPNNVFLEDTGVYGIRQDGDGWRVEKYNALPGEVQVLPHPTTITGDSLGNPYPRPQ